MTARLQTIGSGSVLLSLLALAGCSSGSSGDPSNRGPFNVSLISTGLGQVFPYRIREADANGFPGPDTLNIDSNAVLRANVTANNPVLPVAVFDTSAVLPNGNPGNQFLQVSFSHRLNEDSILDGSLAGQTNSGLTTAVSVLEYDPVTEETNVVKGRGFVGGKTYLERNGRLQLVQAVSRSGAPDQLLVLEPEAQGFPNNFSGADELVNDKTFVFIPDADDDLSTFETYPTNRLIRIVVTDAVQDSDNKFLLNEVCTATTVGTDPNPPDVIGQVSGSPLRINPGNSMVNVDPTTPVRIEFNKPVQPGDMGTFFDPTNLVPGTGGVTLSVTAAASTFTVNYYADPANWSDMCNYIVTPAYNLPGQSTVNFTVNATNVRGLTLQNLGASSVTDFKTGDGPGVINAPVAPEAIYIGLGGPDPGVSVLDLNGFGQGTGDIDNTRWPLNPNIGQPGVEPALSPGSSNLDAGSAGVFTLTQDTLGNTLLLSNPLTGAIGDIHIGSPLDVIFNNFNINRNTNTSNQVNPLTGTNMPGNTISVAPHPNPPRMVFPPPNPARGIFGEEPTRTSSTGPAGSVTVVPPCATTPLNLLNVGNPQAPSSNPLGLGIFNALMPGVFYGPQPPPSSPPPPTPYCPFTSRQQIGHFLYVLDRDNRQVLVVNSNRMTVLDTIKLSDPIDMAMAPNLRHLAVTNFSSGRVSFIDTDPFSSTLHQVVQEVTVERGPTEIAWQPDGEVIMVISPPSNSATLLSGLDFSVIKSVSGFLSSPVDLVLTERYANTGHQSGVYFAYILNQNGTIAVFESGPDGVNGIGFNDIIGIVPNFNVRRPSRIMHDPSSAVGAVYVAHQDGQGQGQISRLELTSSPTGPQAINQNSGGFIVPPTFRQKEWTVVQKFGGTDPTLPTGQPFSGSTITDIALDYIYNNGGSPMWPTAFNGTTQASPTGHSDKATVKNLGGTPGVAYVPEFMFVALADSGAVDVLRLSDATIEATIKTPGVRVVSHYWRQ